MWRVRKRAGRGNSECEGAGVWARYSGNLLRSHRAGELGVGWIFAGLFVVVVVWGGD